MAKETHDSAGDPKIDRKLAVRLREILLASLEEERDFQKQMDLSSRTNKDLRRSIVGSKKEFVFVTFFACALSWLGPFALTWGIGSLTEIDADRLSIVFWTMTIVATGIACSAFTRAVLTERVIYWARLEERAGRVVSTLLYVLDDLDESLPGSVPDLKDYRNYDVQGRSPLIDRALKN
jgi:hypothetical protein